MDLDVDALQGFDLPKALGDSSRLEERPRRIRDGDHQKLHSRAAAPLQTSCFFV